MYYKQNNDKDSSKQNLEAPIEGLVFECLSKNCTE